MKEYGNGVYSGHAGGLTVVEAGAANGWSLERPKGMPGRARLRPSLRASFSWWVLHYSAKTADSAAPTRSGPLSRRPPPPP